ncbi:Hypothetical protein NTJ_08165 [Nesidiocoris tenuis]|uniref:Lipocalin/cytosolic fatty-acid binding domain-containing protein n=1 Tax=Nesidiocoris tenuis TaxID=355587 RepID=A0ABN7AWW1_9HEMI|nr:Hypothetical protein NTJ_08165 [Nesidiocoris tenuis]
MAVAIFGRFAFLLWLTGVSVAVNYFEAEELGPCPHVLPTPDVTLKQLEGKWHLSVAVLDAAKENLEENSVCVTGEVFVHNSTHMKQIWDMYTPHHQEFPVGTVELAMESVRPGVWAVQTPLGSQITGILFGYDLDLAIAVFCGWQKGRQVHLFTAAATREGSLTPSLRLKMSSILLDNGYNPSTTKLIVWSKC